MFEKLSLAAKEIQKQGPCSPKIGLMLGSGLGPFLKYVENQRIIPYKDIPYFPSALVEGQEGRLILGHVGKTEVAILHGRQHAYDGVSMSDLVFPIRTLATLGIEILLLTNASGGIHKDFCPGDLVVIEDHINFIGQNPLVGHGPQSLGLGLPNMNEVYSPQIIKTLLGAANELSVHLKRGVYCAMLGPAYETPAEVRMLERIGADMVGMSTVPEAMAAYHLGLKIGGVSCITNMAAGKVAKEEVGARPEEVLEIFGKLLSLTINHLDAQ